jgi:predicted acyltransferase
MSYHSQVKPQERLLSLDFLRGAVMVLLALEAAGLIEHLLQASGGSALYPMVEQFTHHPWHGLRFWDLVQPCFMFVAGVAMALSLHKQRQSGISWSQSFQKVLRRSGWLFFWGVLIYAVRSTGLSFQLWNVLTQLSFTTLVAFLIHRKSAAFQIACCILLLLLTEVLYRWTAIPGFNQPFTNQHNFGNYIDLVLMNKTSSGGWVAFNCVPTSVHTIAGVLAGQLLLNAGPHKVSKLLLWAGVCLLAGYAIDFGGITPIIKRIATSSFTLVSLGYCLAALAACYWLIDIKGIRHGLFFFTVVGMNSIFIYLFFEIMAGRWFNSYVQTIVHGLLAPTGLAQSLLLILGSLVIFGLEWAICLWLYRKRIFFRV